MRKKFIILFMIVLADMIGFGLILPLLPYYAKEFGASEFIIGMLTAIYPLGQFFAAPIVGRLSDKYGRKPLLLFSVAGTFLSLLLLGFARSILVLFIARLTDGLTGGNITVAQSYISDITTSKNRSKGLGMIGAAFGIGFVFGPVLGGLLSNISYSLPAFIAAGISFINLMLIIFKLPESLDKNEAKARKRVPINLDALKKELKKPIIGPLLLTRLLYSFAFSMFQTTFALYSINKFNYDASQTGLILTYVGIIIVIVQGFLVGKISQKFKDQNILLTTLMIMTPSLVLWGFAPNLTFLLLILIPISFAGGVFNVTINSFLTKLVKREDIGGTLGLSNSLESLSRIFAPLLGGLLIEISGAYLPGLVGGIIVLVSLMLYSYYVISKKDKIIYEEK